MAELDAPDAESKVAKDLFLEALVFAAISVSLLEAVWPNLTADKGKLLNRLMDRLLFVVSFPDPRLRALVAEGDIDLSESWFRINDNILGSLHVIFPVALQKMAQEGNQGSEAGVPKTEAHGLDEALCRAEPETLNGRFLFGVSVQVRSAGVR